MTRTITICNKLGLHARAAARFVQLASRFESEIRLTRGSREANGKSIMGVMMLAAGKGTELALIIEGNDAEEAMAELVGMVENRFGESE
ncbi:MAG TPA: HPr family phosphocarrier protein [Gammaproteobacteria bacterium]|nr:HPr family phosphocarrier protein [Gammaproteobacteria bacterium]